MHLSSKLHLLGLFIVCLSMMGCPPCHYVKKGGWDNCRLDSTRAIEPGMVLLKTKTFVQPIGSWDLGKTVSEDVEIANFDSKIEWTFDVDADLGAVPGLPAGAQAALKTKNATVYKVTFNDSKEKYLNEFIMQADSVRDLQDQVDELIATLRRDDPAKLADTARAVKSPDMEVWLVLGTLNSKVSYTFHSKQNHSLSAPIPLDGITLNGKLAVMDDRKQSINYRQVEPIAYNAIKISLNLRPGFEGADIESIKATRDTDGPDLYGKWIDPD